MPAATHLSRKRRYLSVSKKNCVIARFAPASSLARSYVEVELRARRFRVNFRVRGDRDVEITRRLQPAHEVGGIGETFRMRHVARLARRRVAPQGDDVAHARVPVGPRDVEDLAARRPDAGQVRRGRQRGLAQDARHDVVGAFARRTVGTVGDRHESRRQRREPLDRRPEGLLPSPRRWAGRTRTRPSRAGTGRASRVIDRRFGDLVIDAFLRCVRRPPTRLASAWATASTGAARRRRSGAAACRRAPPP